MDTDTDTDTDKGTGTGGDDSDKSEKLFTPEQQTKVQSLIDDAYKRAYSKALRSNGTDEEVLKLTKEVSDLKEQQASKVKDGEVSSEVKAEIEGLRTQVGTLRNSVKGEALLKAIGKHDVVNTDQIANIISPNIRLNEDNSLSVLTDNGDIATNLDTMKPLSVGEYVTNWVASNPHFNRASGSAGAGSSTSAGASDAGGKVMSRSAFDVLSVADQSKFMSAGGSLVD